ncbi:MAG: ABC-F type ribosomal protection protein [Lachnospiraceae bacterium]|nr:ABC-F type ribosomal protection protein [Lachnospiraceae bacterium]MDY4616169.1 ABC-F type ribosomal protection protein [Lachnospiraceae bacterium]
MILSVQNISKSFGTDEIIKNASFHIEDYEKAAIVGINGAGKSTLLKIIVGELSADTGEVVLSKGKTMGYLAQHQDMQGELTIEEELFSVKKDIMEMEKTIRRMEEEMHQKDGKELEQHMEDYHKLADRFELEGGYSYKSEIYGVLNGLGFSQEEYGKKISELSGGQKTRVALGRLLVTKPDVILLDEPTNHLDMNSIAWLETFLMNYKGAVVIVSHDRYFLDRVVTKVIDISNHKLEVFQGNYSEYAGKKEKLREERLKAYYNQQREIKHQEEVITKLKSFNREKSIKRAESREKLLDKIERIDKPVEEHTDIKIKLEPNIVSGNDVLQVEGLSKTYGENRLFEDIDFEIKRGERVALIGDNGTGKTTILKILNEMVPEDAGRIRLGSNVYIGYYDQEHQVLHMDKTLFEEISDAYPNLTNTQVRNTLAAFLFTDEDVFKRIKDLSGGERGRVSLAKLMLGKANFLILDEPTNHLDIVSKEILESALNQYTGTVLFVSHDRYFINRTATRILDLTKGKLINYIGNYDYYLEKKNTMTQLYEEVSETREKTKDESENKQDWQKQKQEQARLRKIANELKKVEDEIEDYENKIEEIDLECQKPEVATNSAKLNELSSQRIKFSEELEALYERWEELSEDS